MTAWPDLYVLLDQVERHGVLRPARHDHVSPLLRGEAELLECGLDIIIIITIVILLSSLSPWRGPRTGWAPGWGPAPAPPGRGGLACRRWWGTNIINNNDGVTKLSPSPSPDYRLSVTHLLWALADTLHNLLWLVETLAADQWGGHSCHHNYDYPADLARRVSGSVSTKSLRSNMRLILVK